MSDTESLDYLQPGFDARSLTVPRLRSILVAHNIPYSSSSKKSQLVEIFNEQVLPQSKKILAARARAKRSSKGIVDAEPQSSSNPFEEHEELAPRPMTRRSRSPRKVSNRLKTEEPEDLPMPPRTRTRTASPTKRMPRASSRPVQASDTDTAPEYDGNRIMSKVRRAAPKIKKEESDEGLFRRTSDVFTNDNPFQSGSSPSAADRTPSVRRRTAGGDKSRSTSSGTRRRTDVRTEVYTAPAPALAPKEERFSMPRSFGPPIPQRTILKSVEPPTLEAGEEFTPEEQLQLSAEEAERGYSPVADSRQSRQSGGTGWGTVFSVLLVTLVAVYGGWYRQEKIAVGYCGVGQSGSSIPNEIETPEWALSVLPPVITIPQSFIDTVSPDCEPCPLHAYCYTDFSVRCEQDYILKSHPLALWGIVPLPPTCEADGARVRRVKAVADKAIEELREQTGKYECGEPINEEGERLETPAIEEQVLKEIINKKRSKKMNNQEFEDLWGSALGEIKTREEVQVETTDSGGIPNTYLSSTSLARISLTCALRRSVRLGLARYRFHISAVTAFILTAIYARYRYRAIRAAAAQVPALVDIVLERLANQKQLGDEGIDDPWLFLPNLRDDVLRSVHSLSQREKIWHRVRAVVEQNSNVRTGQREGRSGEMGRAWEWIGPIAGDPSSRRRRSNRVSYGPDTSIESPAGVDAHHQKWDETRPIY
ncbi:Man1-Src1p-C-terminal domain-containing protein [Annulohypoxylon maeteangense]|uniref:Man1-Src1p-C-terminal domain-containing protein n=1 Tax=Annulohypoxylon maeteangense TaxID=1927788 RepID=UPI0020087300|nr:Man1-Src1p-C-terminal domain-containing protein [Annulohypoxylon maeteangense]KAI0890658.1 Man1-Src1p-C-terminal domain-containing protein [Annulohypoxylon maeteangense]